VNSAYAIKAATSASHKHEASHVETWLQELMKRCDSAFESDDEIHKSGQLVHPHERVVKSMIAGWESLLQFGAFDVVDISEIGNMRLFRTRG